MSRQTPNRPPVRAKLADVAAFVGTGIAAGLILLTGWDRFDPIASMLVAGLLLWGSYGRLKESGRIFLLAAPESAPPDEVGRAIAPIPGSSTRTTCMSGR